MMKKTGRQTLRLQNAPSIVSFASVVGQKEGEGPIGHCFDKICLDAYFGEKSWEKAESSMLKECFELCCDKLGIPPAELDMVFSGDLLNQCVGSAFALKNTDVPHFGLYGACSTFVQALVVGSALISGGDLDNALCCASSHFCTAERQFRAPLEMGGQRPPSAQWTATASGAVLLDEAKTGGMRVTHGTVGRVIDLKIKDANHMGAAMAPAVADTICAHFEDTGRCDRDYDLIVTGDLGIIGRDLLMELLVRRGVPMDDKRLMDCGASLFSPTPAEADAAALPVCWPGTF